MVNDDVDLRNHRRLREPAIDDDVRWQLGVLVLVAAHIDECPVWQSSERSNQPLEKRHISGAEAPERQVHERRGVARSELRDCVRLLLPDAALEVLKLRGR